MTRNNNNITEPSAASSSLSSSTAAIAKPERIKHMESKHILKHHHAVLLTLTNTFSQLIFKCLPAFVAYIMEDYGFSYSFTITALSIGQLATGMTLVANPLILYLPTNVIFSLFLLFQSLSCFILWYFRHSKAMFIIGVMLLSFIEASCYCCSLAVISTFKVDSNRSHKYLSAVNSGWTIATFLYLAVGFLMKLGAIWLFLEIMFVIFVILAVLNIVFLPQQSPNAYNLNKSNANTVNIKDDIRVLCQIKSYWYILLALVLTFIAWGYFYSSFGMWLKGIFDLNQATFGYAAGLTEGCGNLLGILTVAYLAKSDEDGDGDNVRYKISLQAMMLWGCVVMAVVTLVLWLVDFTAWYNESFIFAWIALYFYGTEACICAALVLLVNVVPPLQQARASAMLGVVQCVTLFFAQSTVAPVYYQFDGMKWEAFLLLILYMLATLDIIYLNKIMNDARLEELLPINNDKNMIQNYT